MHPYQPRDSAGSVFLVRRDDLVRNARIALSCAEDNDAFDGLEQGRDFPCKHVVEVLDAHLDLFAQDAAHDELVVDACVHGDVRLTDEVKDVIDLTLFRVACSLRHA